MILQNILFPSTSTCTNELMYFRKSSNVNKPLSTDFMKLDENDHVSFDTYFNSFSAEKWYKYTTLKKIKALFETAGRFQG